MNNPDEIYHQLRAHLDHMPVGFPKTASGVEIRILKHLFTPEEATIAFGLALVPRSVKRIQTLLLKRHLIELSIENLQSKLKSMYNKGLILQNGGKHKTYSNALLAIGMFEFQVERLTPEFMQDVKIYLEEAFGKEFFSSKIPQLRTSPHINAFTPEYQVATYDDIRKFVTTTKESIGVINCVCKQGADLLGHHCKRTDRRDVCLIIGGSTQMILDREQGRIISKQQTLEILDHAEKAGLILQPGNTYEPFVICCCCGCCCEFLASARLFPRPAELIASNYYAEINSASCVGCKICVKRCQIEAIAMEENKAKINLDRCLGCGLCVTTCKKHAIQLRLKEKEQIPPKNLIMLYLKILEAKLGKKGKYRSVMKDLLGTDFIESANHK